MSQECGDLVMRNRLLATLFIYAALVAAAPAAAGSLEDDLLSRDKHVRTQALVKFQALDDSEKAKIIPALISALESKDSFARFSASFALGKSGPVAIPALMRVLRQAEKYARFAAASSLGGIGQSAVPALIEALHDRDGDFRYYAAVALQRMGPQAKSAVAELRATLNDASGQVRAAAAAALGQIGPDAQETIPDLMRSLKDKDPAVRRSATGALGGIGVRDDVVLSTLLLSLRNEDPLTRAAAAKSLGQLGPLSKEVTEALLQTVKGGDCPGAGPNAVAALGAVRPVTDEIVTVLTSAMKLCSEMEGPATEAVGNLGAARKEVVPAIFEHWAARDHWLREPAARAIVKIGAAAVPALIERLQSEEKGARVVAAWFLGKLGAAGTDAVPALSEALKDQDLSVRATAHYALKSIGTPAAMNAADLYERSAASLGIAKVDPQHLYTKEKITATVPPDENYRNALELDYATSMRAWNPNELFVTLHKGSERPDRLVIWAKTGEEYKALEIMNALEGPWFSYFDDITRFSYKNGLYIHVPLYYTGTGHHREDTVFAILPDNTLQVVDFQPAPEWYKDKLQAGEGVWKGAHYAFSDNRLEFEFYIWNANDANARHPAGKVTGTFKVITDRLFDREKQKWVTHVKMVVDEYERVPITK